MDNFYSDFSNLADQNQQSTIISSANLGGVPDYLQTVVAGKAAVTTTVSALPPNSLNLLSIYRVISKFSSSFINPRPSQCTCLLRYLSIFFIFNMQ